MQCALSTVFAASKPVIKDWNSDTKSNDENPFFMVGRPDFKAIRQNIEYCTYSNAEKTHFDIENPSTKTYKLW